jgi:hypothetical protein
VGEYAFLRSFLGATLADTGPNVSEAQAIPEKLSKIQKMDNNT